jgi:hypothetical protein
MSEGTIVQMRKRPGPETYTPAIELNQSFDKKG